MFIYVVWVLFIIYSQLRNFANAARQLGSSVAILSSALCLRERLAQLLFLYHENAADLFPRKVIRDIWEPSAGTQPMRQIGRSRTVDRTPSHVARPTVNEKLDPEYFPELLTTLANDLATFLDCLNEFPEFTDEAMNASIRSFEDDLKVVWCLLHYDSLWFSFYSIGRRVWKNILVSVYVFYLHKYTYWYRIRAIPLSLCSTICSWTLNGNERTHQHYHNKSLGVRWSRWAFHSHVIAVLLNTSRCSYHSVCAEAWGYKFPQSHHCGDTILSHYCNNFAILVWITLYSHSRRCQLLLVLVTRF